MKQFLLIMSLLFYVCAYSQYENRSGYIVKKDGEIEEGLINFQGSEFNAQNCEFKKDINADPVVFLPKDITAYRLINSKYFISKKVLIEDKEIDIFLECLISGKATIYYTRWNSHDHFYIEKDGKMVEMNNNYINTVIDGKDFQRPSNQYKGVLKYFFRDCPQITQEIDKADFTKKSLIKISKDYHEYICDDEQCIVYEKESSKRRIDIGLDFSYGISKLEFMDSHMQMSIEPKIHYQFGINSQINLGEEGAFNLQTAIRYYSYKNDILNDMGYEIGTFPSDVHYQYSILKPEVQLKYKMKIWKMIPFASVGVFTNFFLVDKGIIYNERFDKTLHFTSGGIDVNTDHMNAMLGYLGEIGLETRLEPGNLSLSFFYENFLTKPFRTSYNMGLRCGYSFSFK